MYDKIITCKIYTNVLKFIHCNSYRLMGYNSERVISTKFGSLEKQIEKIYEQKSKGAQVRSREKWVELGEKNNSYFLGLEKQRQIKKSINKLYGENQEILENQCDLLSKIKKYYEELYKTKSPNKVLSDNYISETKLDKTLDKSIFSVCDGKITLEECKNAIFKMKLNKSPGLDGLTVEFYRLFWDKLKHFLVEVFNEGHDKKCLSYSQRTSILTLIFKKGDPLSLDNYRPISLLNVDLKILSCVLAQRLKIVLPKIVNEDQTGYVKNRFIGFNLRQIQDIIDYSETYKIEGAIIFVDFTKAFDSLEWNFMFTTLKHFGFNDSFIQWVETLYANIQTCVMNNGWVSEVFENSRGIRQGCPLSALLFVLAVEIMAIRLRNNKDLKGITVKLDAKDHTIKISQLADDTTLFCNSKSDVEIAMNEIEVFGSFSGLILNRNKTEGMWIGKLKSCKDKIGGISWNNKPIKALGAYFGHNREECEKLNWETKIEKMNRLFLLWEKRKLTILGKILIIKTLILPIFTFLASSFIVPEVYQKEIEKQCFKFIWDGKPDKVKRNVIISSHEKGGLNMIDIKSYFKSLRAIWVSRLVDGNLANWKLIPLKYFNATGKNWLVFQMNNEGNECIEYLKNIPKFYTEVVSSWNASGGGQVKKPVTFSDIRKQVIWGNKFIKFKNKSIVFENWIKSGLVFLNDILDETGSITQDYIYERLQYKSNWIAEYNILKKSIPSAWIPILKSENSVRSIVNISRNKLIWKGKYIETSALTNIIIYNSLISDKIEKSLGINKWNREFNMQENPDVTNLYYFIFNYIEDNKLKIFRWKLLQYILPNRKLLFQWKIANNSLCNHCTEDEDYKHYFLSCNFLKYFWVNIHDLLKRCNVQFSLKLKHLVFGYKISDKNYFWLNYILTIIGFSIYKAYYVSEQKSKQIDVYRIFMNEYNKRLNEKNRYKNNSFLRNIQKKLL